VTLHDIAARAGVTRITVSRYLREPERVAAETAQRVQQAIDALGYVPNVQAGQLASGHSRLVAALIPNIGHSIFAETIQGLIEGLDGSGYELMLMSYAYSLEREVEQLRAVLGWHPAALIVTGRQHLPATHHLLQQAVAHGTPVFQIWDHARPKHPAGWVQVGFDHREVGAQMAEHLMACGHRALAFVDSGVVEDFRAHERAQGFVHAARQAGLVAPLLNANLGDPTEAGRAALHELRQAHPHVRAVAFANDQFALGALLEAQTHGLEVPKDLAVLGFGDFPLGAQIAPGLSTLRPPRVEIGRTTAEILRQRLLHGQSPTDCHLPCALVVRGSTAVNTQAKV